MTGVSAAQSATSKTLCIADWNPAMAFVNQYNEHDHGENDKNEE